MTNVNILSISLQGSCERRVLDSVPMTDGDMKTGYTHQETLEQMSVRPAAPNMVEDDSVVV